MTFEATRSDSFAADPPARSRWAIGIPIVVFLLIAALITWSAWPTLMPVRSVTVVQAVFDRSAQPPDADSSAAATGGESIAGQPRADGGKTVQAPGWLEAEPFYVACTALADGVVESIDVLEGDRVTKGQIVARLVDEDSQLKLDRAEAELATARSELALAEADLRAAQDWWDEPVDRVRAVEAKKSEVAEREAELAQLPSMIEAARATLVQYEEEAKRAAQSQANRAATEIEVIIARQRALSQKATVESLEAKRPLLAARVDRLSAELHAAERHLELRIEERRELDAAKANLERAKAMVDRAEAARDEAVLELERMTIRAPIDGYVQRRLKVEGDKVIRGMDSPHSAHLVHLYDPSRIQVRVDVPLADASHVFVGQPCEVVVEVLPDRTFQGEVLRTTHEADLQKNTLQIKVGVSDPSPLLRPEMLTRVKFLPGNGHGSDATRPADSESRGAGRVLVPTQALDDRDGTSRVWMVADRRGDRGVVRSVPVQRMAEQDGWAVVSGPIEAGAILAVSTDELREGERVRIQSAEEEGSS